ncbi:hypothetical protein Q9L58_009898, partial [Maublancomyces gigas]
METLGSSMDSLTGVQNEQATTLKSFAKIIAEVHQFKTQCSPHNITIMKEMNAFQATITSLTARITALEATPSPPPPQPQDTIACPSDQLLALVARIDVLEPAPTPPPPPPPPPPLFPSALPPPPSPSPSYAAVASKAPGPPAKPSKEKTRRTVTKLRRQLVITCNPSPPTTVTNDTILASGNNALRTNGDRFILARRSLKNNLVLQTGPANTASEAIDHSDAIAFSLKDLGCTPTLMRPNAVWTSFPVHSVPTCSDLEKVAVAIKLDYPTLTLCQHSRWLSTADKRKEKTHSTMVITLPRQLTLATWDSPPWQSPTRAGLEELPLLLLSPPTDTRGPRPNSGCQLFHNWQPPHWLEPDSSPTNAPQHLRVPTNTRGLEPILLPSQVKISPKESPASSPCPDLPRPDEMALTATTTMSEGSTPDASLIAKVASLVELVQALHKDLTATQAQLIIELSSPIPSGVTDYPIIIEANKAHASTEVVFRLAQRTTRGKIILLTHPNISASSAETYSSILAASLQAMGCTPSSTRANPRWTKLLVHGVQTTTTPSHITEEISATYPTRPTLAQTPRCLTTPATRTGKMSPIM